MQKSDRLFRLKYIIWPHGPLPISAASWWAGVKSGRFPPGVKLGPRTTAWRGSDIEQLVNEGRWASNDDHHDTSDSAGRDHR
mgnify:CR=1 FL=1